MSLALVVLILVLQGASCQFWGTSTAAVKQPEGLDKLEDILCQCTNAIQQCIPLIKATAATALLLHGNELVNTVLLLQAFKMSGMEGIKSSLEELGSAYKRGRQSLKDEMPAIMAAKTEIKGFASKMAKFKTDLETIGKDFESKISKLKSQKMTVSQLAAEKSKLLSLMEHDKVKVLTEMQKLRDTKKKIDAASNSIKTVVASIQPEHLKSALASTWTSVLAIVSVAKSKAAASVAMGLNFGTFAYDNVVVRVVPMHILVKSSGGTTWLGGAINSACSTLGVFLSFFLAKAATTWTACSIGADLLTGTVVESLEKHLRVKFPPIAVAAVKTSLVAIAAIKQLAASKKGPNNADTGGVKVPRGMGVFSLFLIFEKVLANQLR